MTEGQPLSQDKVFEALDDFRETFNTLLEETGTLLELVRSIFNLFSEEMGKHFRLNILCL